MSPSMTVGELVVERPARARLFERLGLDYCCAGRRPLAEACRERGLDPETVATLLDALDDMGETDPAADWASVPLGELCDHIVDQHHALLRRELPRLGELIEKAEQAHGRERPELHRVHAVFTQLRKELEEHLDDEEETLFPTCRKLAEGAPGAGGLGASLEELEAEHAVAGAQLARLRELTSGYDEGGALCNTHRAALTGLAELERDLHEHIHEENNILFPRALELAAG